MPEYTVHPGDIMIKFTGPEDRIVRVTDKVTEKVIDQVIDKVTEREYAVLKLLEEDPGYTTVQLAEKMQVTRKTVSVYIKSLKDKKIIERVGSDRKGYWKTNSENE